MAFRSLPARYPPHGAWPGQMRADIATAFFDYTTTGEFYKAIERGEAPGPSSERQRNGRREPLWALEICQAHIAIRHQTDQHDPESESIAGLI